MKNLHQHFWFIGLLLILSCQSKRDQEQIRLDIQSIDLKRGEVTLCGSEDGQFGKVEFPLSCSEKVRADFNLATALLHSFEYAEAEKVFAKVIDADPECLMAYWGVAMSNFHPLWAAPSKEELGKGSATIRLARSLEPSSPRESDYLEAVATIYDDYDKLDHSARLLKFENAAQEIYQKYPEDREAAIFYSLALRAASDPADKSFAKQKKAGKILNSLFSGQPDHPGVAHYLIHTYDYPELAELALPAARKYASIAATSAHALHMPSHIFTRLGLWEESVQSNINSMSAAKCYAENSGIKGHWDEELHGMDYLVYAYLQQGRDDKAKEQVEYLRSITSVFPLNNKNAYTFAAVPTRYALERKDWEEASQLELKPADFPWDEYLWEKAILIFGRIQGSVHLNKISAAKSDLGQLKSIHGILKERNRTYEANQVHIQIKASEAWISFLQKNKAEAFQLMTEAADMEDATEKHPVTPGEVVPARELLGDLYMEAGEFAKALAAYEEDLKRHPQRFNGVYGAAVAADRSGDRAKALMHFKKLTELGAGAERQRPEIREAELLLQSGGR